MSAALVDTGFADSSVVSPLVRRLGLRAGLQDVLASAQAQLNILDQKSKSAGCDGPVLSDERAGLTASDFERGTGKALAFGSNGDAVREQQLLQGVNLVAQLLERLDVGIRHGLFSGSIELEASEAGQSAHRLCGVAK